MIGYKIDWLTLTLVFTQDVDDKRLVSHTGTTPITDILGNIVEEEIRPVPFYTNGTKYEFGSVFVNEKNPLQKTMVVVTGDDWSNIALAGKDPAIVLKNLLKYPEAKVTRLDFAVDIRERDFRINTLLAAWRAGNMKTSAESVQLVGRQGKAGKDLGKTLYIGSRSSERMIRCYDKGAQTETRGQWVRIEIELKGRWAMATALEMASGRVVEAGKAAIRQFVTTGVSWFDSAVQRGKGDGYIVPDKRAQTDHEKWLMNIAVPAVLKAIQSDVDWVETAVLGAILAKHRGPIE